MELSLYLQESCELADIIQNVRDEVTSAVRGALLQHAYDTDIQLSFGYIHINSRGSVSQISFNGQDIIDMDSFVVKQALRVGDENYYDIRQEIKESPAKFCFYPILIRDKFFFTVLKGSPYFVEKYGDAIHYERFRVKYASKYLIVYRNDYTFPDIYYVGLFSPEATANTLLQKAGKTIGGKTIIYYLFMNSRPELFLHIGLTKPDFAAYKPEQNLNSYNFYKGNIISGIFKINKKTDANGKIKVKETRKNCFQKIIEMQYGSIDKFCETFNIERTLLTAFLSGADTKLLYKNGNALTPTRLEEILNLPFVTDADGLKDSQLLVKINYYEIPE